MKVISPIKPLLENLGRYVCPIYVKQDIRSQTPYLIGTGTLFQDEDEFYLITAKHVIEGADESQLYTMGDKNFVQIVGEQMCWENLPNGDIAYDVCIIHLHPEAATNLKAFYRYSTPTDVSDIAAYNEFIVYAFVGYPHTKNKPQPSSVDKVESKSYYYLLGEFINLNTLKKFDKNPTAHFALSAPFKKFKNFNFVKQMPPQPHGISGGGVWKIELNRDTRFAHSCKLVGIGIEYLREQNAFIAARIYLAVYAQIMLKALHKQ